jgi:DNA-binding transcriptional ArsR family regulator
MANEKLGPQKLPEFVAQRTIADPVVIKALADPLRLRIMRLMEEGAHEQPRNFTVKQIATALEEPPTKLYRHVKQLLKVGLIQIAELRLVGGIVEQHYRVAQAAIAIDMRAADHLDDEVVAVAGAAVDDFLRRYSGAIEAGSTYLQGEDSLAHSPHVRNAGVICDMRIPQAKAAEFGVRLHELIREFTALEHTQDGVDANLLAFYYATDAKD